LQSFNGISCVLIECFPENEKKFLISDGWHFFQDFGPMPKVIPEPQTKPEMGLAQLNRPRVYQKRTQQGPYMTSSESTNKGVGNRELQGCPWRFWRGGGQVSPHRGGLARDSRLIERVMKKNLKSFKYDLYLA
jgi:hypothetical protein